MPRVKRGLPRPSPARRQSEDPLARVHSHTPRFQIPPYAQLVPLGVHEAEVGDHPELTWLVVEASGAVWVLELHLEGLDVVNGVLGYDPPQDGDMGNVRVRHLSHPVNRSLLSL